MADGITQKFLVPGGAEGAALMTQLADINNSVSVTQACAETLILQPPFGNGLLATLPEDQALASAHAKSFEDAGGFGYASGTINAIKSISIVIAALLGEDTLHLAEALDRDDPHAASYESKLSNLRFVLSAVGGTVNDSASGQNNLSLLLKMQSKLQVLEQDIEDDGVKLRTAMQLASDQDLISRLEQQQQDLQGQLRDINAEIARGALDKIPDAIAFGVEIGALGLGEGVAGGVAGGALAIYGFSKEVAAYNDEIAETYKKQAAIGRQIVDVTTQIASDKTDYAILTLIAAQMGVFHDQVHALLALMESLLDELSDWQKLIDLMGDYDSPAVRGFFVAQVTAGEQFWSSAAGTLDRYSNLVQRSGLEKASFMV